MRQTVVLHPSPTYVGQVGAHKCHIKHARTLKWAPVFKYITTHGLSIKHGELQSVISRRDPPPQFKHASKTHSSPCWSNNHNGGLWNWKCPQ